MPLCKMSIPDLCDSGLLRQGLRVLVVDGNLDSRELMKMIFAECGVETVTAASVSQAVSIIQQSLIDLVIREIALPDEDGYSLLRKLQALHIQVPVIALTVFASNDDRHQALAAGFCQHLSKPLDLDQFIATVASVTQRVQAEEATV